MANARDAVGRICPRRARLSFARVVLGRTWVGRRPSRARSLRNGAGEEAGQAESEDGVGFTLRNLRPVKGPAHPP
jgi:hypothetical protein